MGVLLGLGDVQLAHAALGEHLGERLRHVLLAEDDGHVEIVAVARHRRQVEAAVEQQPGQLPPAIRPEVEEDHAVARLDSRRVRRARSAR